MGDEAEEIRDDLTPEENTEAEEITAEVEETESEEVDVSDEETEVTDGTDAVPIFTQQDLEDKLQRRLAREARKKSQSNEDLERVARELEMEREKNKLLELERQQRAKPSGPPNPDDFDGGEFDPAFRKAQEAHQAKLVEDTVAQKLAETQRLNAEKEADLALRKEIQDAQIAHYQRAAALKVADFEEREDRVRDHLGQRVHDVMVQACDNSEAVVLYLDKNPQEMDRLKRVVSSNNIKGFAELMLISHSLRPKRTSSKAPDPVQRLEGSTSAASKDPALKGVKFE